MGACEPEPVLDRGWFTAAASRAMLVHSRIFGDIHPVRITGLHRLQVQHSAVLPAGALGEEESAFLVSALRSVGIPARQVYVPRWSHCGDNHARSSWVGRSFTLGQRAS